VFSLSLHPSRRAFVFVFVFICRSSIFLFGFFFKLAALPEVPIVVSVVLGKKFDLLADCC